MGAVRGCVDECLDHRRVQLVGGLTAGRTDVHSPLRRVVEQRRCHLAPPGIVDADEEHDRDVGRHAACSPGCGTTTSAAAPAMRG